MTPYEAREEIFDLIKTSISSFTTYVKWPDKTLVKPNGVAWADIEFRIFDAKLRGMGDHRQKYEYAGMIYVHFYARPGEGLSAAYDGGIMLLTALRGRSTPNGVWFRKTYVSEREPIGGSSVVVMTSEFEFTDVRTF